MNSREAFARAIDKKMVTCPYINYPPFALSDTWLDSAEARPGGKPCDLYAICAQACNNYDLELSGTDLFRDTSTTYHDNRYDGCQAFALSKLRQHQNFG